VKIRFQIHVVRVELWHLVVMRADYQYKIDRSMAISSGAFEILSCRVGKFDMIVLMGN